MALDIGKRPRTLQYAVGGLREDYVLLEVDEGLLRIIESEGVDIQGGAEDEAVMCTSDSTYALKCVDTTNLLLLIPPNQEDDNMEVEPSLTPDVPDTTNPVDIGLQTQLQKGLQAAAVPAIVARATAKAHLEVTRIGPRLHQLKELLGRPYSIDDESTRQQPQDSDVEMTAAGSGPGGQEQFLTTDQLLELVQASRFELLSGLKALRAVQLGGRWRLVDSDYLGKLLELVITCCTQQGWDLKSIPGEECAALLQEDGYEPALTLHCLKVYSSSSSSSSSPGTSQAAAAADSSAEQPAAGSSSSSRFSLVEKQVCLHYARKLLRRQQRWARSELLAAWQVEVPPPFVPDASMLAGEVVAMDEDPSAADPQLYAFPAASLPQDPAARFLALFQLRPRWTQEALEPYLAGMQVPGQTVETLLLKYARASQSRPTDPIVFSARWQLGECQ